MQKFATILYILFAIAAGVFAYTLWRSNHNAQGGRSARPGNAPPQGSGGAATRLLQTVQGLQRSNAQWPAILAALNPEGDMKVGAMLAELRGPHMFAPHTALSLLASTCESKLRSQPSATKYDVLVAAKNSMEKVTRYGD